MKTTMWLASASIVLFVGAAFVVVPKEPFSADQDSPQLIRIGATHGIPRLVACE